MKCSTFCHIPRNRAEVAEEAKIDEMLDFCHILHNLRTAEVAEGVKIDEMLVFGHILRNLRRLSHPPHPHPPPPEVAEDV